MSDDVLTTLPADARAKIDDYLDAIEVALRDGGTDRSGRRAIVDDVEGQLRDVMSATPGPHDASSVAGVLASFDPPERYAAAEGDEIAMRSTAARGAGSYRGRTGVGWFAVSFASAAVLVAPVLLRDRGPGIHSDGLGELLRVFGVIAVPLAMASAILATAQGWSMLAAIGRGTRDRRALPAAMLSALAWPTIVTAVPASIVSYALLIGFGGGPSVPSHGLKIHAGAALLLTLGVGLALMWLWIALRTANGRGVLARGPLVRTAQ